MAYLELEALSKFFGKVRAADNVSLSIEKGECLALLGPSGCGKTTLLRMIAGLEPPDAGRILLDGKDVTKLPPEKRRVGLVFQNYALFPHLSVFDNVAFGLAARSKNRVEITKKVEQSLDIVQLLGLEQR
ncbi:MAG: ABC transporter ATP-binding protein, partial [Blastocatellia bacterium]|nr:ABC transporter ATP-binding protein [Blastocatellia bacterium]